MVGEAAPTAVQCETAQRQERKERSSRLLVNTPGKDSIIIFFFNLFA